MTEARIVDLITVIEAERDGRLSHARAAEELAAACDLVHNDLAEWKLAAHRGIPIPEKAIDEVRKRIRAISDTIVSLGNESAQSCASLTRRLPPKPVIINPGEPAPVDEAADTRDMDLDEIAAVGDKD